MWVLTDTVLTDLRVSSALSQQDMAESAWDARGREDPRSPSHCPVFQGPEACRGAVEFSPSSREGY